METKILIITQNSLNESFWSQHLKIVESEIEMVHLDDFEYSERMQNHLLIIMDDYFANDASEIWMRYQSSLLRSKNFSNKIIFLSPKYADRHQQDIMEIFKVSKHSFGLEFIAEANTHITNRTLLTKQM